MIHNLMLAIGVQQVTTSIMLIPAMPTAGLPAPLLR